MCYSLQPHGLQHTRLPCPSPTPGAYSDSYPSVMASNHLILCHPFLLLPSIFPSIRVFSNESVFHWRRQWHPTPVLLPGESHRQRSLVGCHPWGLKKSDTTERLHFHALEKEMAIHSSVLAWRTPGMGEPGGLPSMGLHSQTRLK